MKLMRLFDCERVISRTPSRFIHLIFHSVVYLLLFSRSLRASHKSVLRKSPQPLIKLELSLVFVSIFILEIQILLSFDIEKEKALDVIGPFLDNIIMHNARISLVTERFPDSEKSNHKRPLKIQTRINVSINCRSAQIFVLLTSELSNITSWSFHVLTWKNVKKREN